MSFDLTGMGREPVARVVVIGTSGSTPREVGAAMLVFANRVEGTIGGGALEYRAIEQARAVLADGCDRVESHALGPGLGQCCGGAVKLLIERWDVVRLATINDAHVIRPMPGKSPTSPPDEGSLPNENESPRVVGDWVVETVSRPSRDIWIWGAGHVGHALARALGPLPRLRVYLADFDVQRLPAPMPSGVEPVLAENPADLVTLAADHAEHFVMTHSHELDLEICHRVLSRPFAGLGLIGSDTKKARFRSRLTKLGHSDRILDRLDCPIGDPDLGKHPQQIAIGVAAKLITVPKAE